MHQRSFFNQILLFTCWQCRIICSIFYKTLPINQFIKHRIFATWNIFLNSYYFQNFWFTDNSFNLWIMSRKLWYHKYTLKMYTLLKIENNSPWVILTHTPEKTHLLTLELIFISSSWRVYVYMKFDNKTETIEWYKKHSFFATFILHSF